MKLVCSVQIVTNEKYFEMKDKSLAILLSQYHDWWWPGTPITNMV